MKYQGTKRYQSAFVSPMGSFVKKPKNQTVGAGVGVAREQVGVATSNSAETPLSATSQNTKTYADFFLAVQADYPGRIPVWQGIYPDETYEGDYLNSSDGNYLGSVLNDTISNNATMLEEATNQAIKSGNRRRRWAATALGETPKRDGPFAPQARSIMQKNPPKAITLKSANSRKLPFGIDPWGFKTPQAKSLSTNKWTKK